MLSALILVLLGKSFCFCSPCKVPGVTEVGLGDNKDNNKGKVCWSFRVMAIADFLKYYFSIILCATNFFVCFL